MSNSALAAGAAGAFFAVSVAKARAVMGVGRTSIPLGVVFSVTGSYRTVGQEMANGALLAVSEINEDPSFDFELQPIIRDPGGDSDDYRIHCEEILRDRTVRHIIGCYTSSSRKEVIPVVEKFDALLWYPSHYEGFESSRNVIYTGASPNQHIVPLLGYMLRQFGRRVYCLGSNYIWAWENNRILRGIVQAVGGKVLEEKYHPVGSTDIGHFISEIAALRPSFIFNTLIGDSSYAFYRAYTEAGITNLALGPKRIPVASCSLSEPELISIGPEFAAGHIASSVYFQSIDRKQNQDFVERYRRRFGASKVTSADAEASYIAVILLARAIRECDSTEIETVKSALRRCRVEAPQGCVWIDPDNNHSYLTPALGRSRSDGQFEILWTAEAPVKPDPYLVWLDPSAVAGSFTNTTDHTHLKVVS